MGPGACRAGSDPLKHVFCLAAALLAAGVFTVYALPYRMGKIISPPRSFALHGKWYSAGKSSKGNSLIQEELSRQGFDITRLPRGALDLGDGVPDPLFEIPTRKRFRPFFFPAWFQVENSLQMESEDGLIDIAYGRNATAGGSARKELVAEGWTVVGMGGDTGPLSMATIRRGRETSIVFLEEKEGDCLFVRRLEK